MTVTFRSGDLLQDDAEALVNPVNCVGIMGKGLALIFKRRFPENFVAYESACRRGLVRIGAVFVTESAERPGPRWIVNLPTKNHWRHSSDIEWIRSGLAALKTWAISAEVKTIAVPSIGAGNGGLDWLVVQGAVVASFEDLPGIEARLYPPKAWKATPAGHRRQG